MKQTLLSLMALTAITTSAMAQASAPAVTMEVVEITSSELTLKFTANEATGTYYCCQYVEGEFEAQYNILGTLSGFQEYGDMVTAWGLQCVGVTTHTWKNCVPNTNYEIWVQPTDADGNYGELQCFTVSTIGQGGDGVAVINIEIGQSFDDEVIGYWQQVIYTPNDQTAVYFDLICTQEFYDENGADGVIAYLKAEDDPSDPYYTSHAHFRVDDAPWNVEPATKYHACAIGKNAKGEWGELTDVVFTTEGYVEPVSIQTIECLSKAKGKAYNLQGQRVHGTAVRGMQIQEGRIEFVR